MASKCFKKYGKEWSKEARKATLNYFGNLPDTPLKHIVNKQACVGYSKLITIPLYAKEVMPEECEKSEDIIFLFTFEKFSIFTGPTGLKFYNSYPSLEAMMDDGWVID